MSEDRIMKTNNPGDLSDGAWQFLVKHDPSKAFDLAIKDQTKDDDKYPWTLGRDGPYPGEIIDEQ